jgi:hypothetical protein
LAKHEGEFEGAAATSLDMAELIRALRQAGSADAKERQAAIACLLSASDGWRQAAKQLGGAFAEGNATTRLTDDQER